MHQEFIDYLKDCQKILIICSHPLDFDSLGSGLLLNKYLEKDLQKDVTLVFPRKMAKEEKGFNCFLPGFDQIKDQDTRELFKDNIEFDAVIFLDGGSPTQFYDSDLEGKEPEFKKIKKSVHIDHHMPQARLGDLMIQEKLSSTIEVLLTNVIPMDSVDKDMATLAYAGFVGDTGNFKWSFTPKTMEIAAQLLEKGADIQEIFERAFFSKSAAYFKMLAYASDKIEFYPKLGTVMLCLSDSLIKKDKLRENDIDLVKDVYISEIARSIKGFPRGLWLNGEIPGRVKVSFRGSNLYNKVDMKDVLTKAGGSGGGHFNALGFAFQGELDLVKRNIIKQLKLAIEKV
jgi:bifunctional oligoribonuclease and PAP phosphatase NrnA